MQPLDRSLRRGKLEPTVKTARDIAEAGARAALGQLGVGEGTPFANLSSSERDLRQKLRAHGRQLGDSRNAKTAVQSIDLLVEEVAYEHWHRMLFARFLAENNLLMYPDPDQPVPVTLEECEELAADEGAKDGWELAARFASRMLPQIFRPDSPVFQLRLPPEHQLKLERLVADLPTEVFTASDSLGWVYQFWQAKKKDEVNNSEVKIGARELPAVTQLFTEPYMVAFLLDNSLGAWWAARRLSADDLRNAESEEELRAKAALPGAPLEYLRFVKEPGGAWTPAAGAFDAWPASLSELKVLDPCCGSGHFLAAAFLTLAAIRSEMEGLSAGQGVDAVLRDNIHGLEVDKRCTEIAAFNLALTAWRYPGAGGYRALPNLNIACSGSAVGATKEEWQKLANGDKSLRLALGVLHEEFAGAPILGSLLNPRQSDAAKLVDWNNLAHSLTEVLAKERSVEENEAGVIARGLIEAARLLAGKYHLVITNVPYLGRGNQSDDLRAYCEARYPAAKNDLATVFLDRCLEFCHAGGTTSIVLPQNWLFLTSYRKFREKLLSNDIWHIIARLGPQAFQTPMWDFNVQLITLSRGKQYSATKKLILNENSDKRLWHVIAGIDVSNSRTATEKAVGLLNAEIRLVEQAKQLENPDARVALEEGESGELLEKYAYSHEGLTTGDIDRFVRRFWEVTARKDWVCFIQNAMDTLYHSGRTDSVFWENKGKTLASFPGSFIKGRNAWGHTGLRITQMRELPVTLYTGEVFGKNGATVIPHNPAHLPAIWCFCSSPEYSKAVRQIDQSLKVTNATLVKVPFDLPHWTKVAEEKYPNGLPKPYSDDPTQWLFHGHPVPSDEPLQVAVARLLGYRWPAELDSEMELSDEARALVKKSERLLSFADKDGIVCIPSVRGEAPAAGRLINLLAAAYGDRWTNDTLSQLLNKADHAGKSLETWLRDKFFTRHCRVFHHRPFIWHIWDGLRDGFGALVNYHKLDAKLLERLIYTYLGDWIARQKQDQAKGIDGAEEKLAAAEGLKKRLELIMEGEKPYDIFVRWKPIEQQPIGWNPDLNDGVRLNIRPFLSAPDVGKKGAGVLRDRPNINWEKDRGKDVASAPWHHLFKGDRINDHHLSLAEKRAAREAMKERGK